LRALRKRRSRALGALALLAAVATALVVGLPGGPGGPPPAAGQTGAEEVKPQTDASVPARDVTLIGSSPLEAPAETWGIGQVNDGTGTSAWGLVRYAEGAGWSLGPELLDTAGQPLAGFVPDRPLVDGLSDTSPLAGQVTPNGNGVMVGTVPTPPPPGATQPGPPQKVVLVRNPEGPFQETAPVPPPPTEPPAGGGEPPLLKTGETLFGTDRAPLIAPLEEAGGGAGALVVPVDEQGSGVEDGVLHWNGTSWTREPIAIPANSATDFRVLAIGASSPSNAWLLGQLASNSHYPPGAVELFRRQPGGPQGASWQPVAPEPLTVRVQPVEGQAQPNQPFTVHGTGEPPTVAAQILTVTAAGVWVDGERPGVGSTTIYFKPEGAADSGQVVASWCQLPANAAAKTPECIHELPEPLPTGPSRSFAWADPATPEGAGERVIAGLPDGVSLRLEGSAFKRVLALGGSNPPNDVGGTFGAAFSEPFEGWLGDHLLPVHLTRHPVASRLTPYPVPFRHALVAIAPQPEAPIGALSSEAIAVGDQGQVGRYKPSVGWLPESLLGPGGRLETPRLRAVAWPRPNRIYAVGDRGQMWLWRGETGLWEQDPATPFNFRGNLLGIAFEPNEPARGYAVGQEGTLLRYGKTWTQEKPCEHEQPQPCLPPQVAGATFTSVAFAGSEAIVAYHLLPEPSTNLYTGGLLVNDGSGWQIDEGAAKAMGQNVPWAVAGLPDGGAAFTAGEDNGSGDGGLVFERENAGASWQPTATPLPGTAEPGSLALFREGGALRAVASGSVPDTYSLESVTPPPPGFPPNLIQPVPLSAGYGAGHVIRQTATGWSDEEHELNDVQEPPGNYVQYDMVYQPDPISAVLTDPTGSQGWAVGGFVDTQDTDGALDTADVERYPADGVAPPGVGSAQVTTNPNPATATFAFGGGAQCAAPCADRQNAGIGPEAWLSTALAHAGQIPGVQAFLYTGPHVTSGDVTVQTIPVPYQREQERYAQIVASSPRAFVAPSPSDLDGADSEQTFAQAFKELPQGGLVGADPGEQGCERDQAGCQASYYAWSSGGVRVIVLDDSEGDVSEKQLKWLAKELVEAAETNAQKQPEPAIVVGNADLNAQIATGDADAAAVAQTLVGDSAAAPGDEASAYFYDSPEQNVTLPLTVGGRSIPTFGSGTLGYVNYTAESSGAFLGASGFLLGEVDLATRNATTDKAEVTARLIPNVGELALEAQGGTLLRRSESALFAALARRPRAGNRSQNQAVRPDTDPYIPIPSVCVGAACAHGLQPEYSFSSSRPDLGAFVERNTASPNPNTVLLGPGQTPVSDEARYSKGEHKGELIPGGRFEENAKGQPINDNGEVVPPEQSGLFCAYNAETTTVTIEAGGLKASLPVTIQAGSVRRPCGTTPLSVLPTHNQHSPAPAPPPPPPSPAPAGAAPTPVVLPAPPPPAPPVVAPLPPAPPRPVVPPAPFVALAVPTAPLLAFVPPPPPTPPRPTPPSGTSAVTSTEVAAKEEREDEEATESVANQALAYRAPEHEPAPVYVLGFVVLAAFAGAAIRRPRRGRRELHVAPATLSTIRAQRRMAPRRRRPW
jgi:hypothetical protein